MEFKIYLHNKIQFIEVKNNLGFNIVFTPAGASVVSVYINDEKIIDNALDETQFLDLNNKFGKTFDIYDKEVIIDGVKYTPSEKMRLNNYLFACKPVFNKDSFLVQFSFKKKHLSDGLPGNITYYVTYALKDNSNEIAVDYRAISDKKTLINMNHIIRFNHQENIKYISNKEIELSKYNIKIIGDQNFKLDEDNEICSMPEINNITSTSFKKIILYQIKKIG